MAIRKHFGFLALAGLVASALLTGCGSSKNNSIPATATIFYAHSAAFSNQTSQTLFTWGYNGFGQLGNTNLVTTATAAPVPNLGPMNLVATGADHTLAAFKNNTTVMSWGSNYHGQLGLASISTTGTGAYSQTPVQIHFAHDVNTTALPVKAIAAGGFHSLAVVGDQVYGWGYNGFGQVGDNTLADRIIPTPVSSTQGAFTDIIDVAAGGTHSLALTSNITANGNVYAWGNNTQGQLGIDPTSPNSLFLQEPAQQVQFIDSNLNVVPLANIKQIAASGSTSYALATDGTLWAWGYNGKGQLGLDPTSINPATHALDTFRFRPVKITLNPDVFGAGVTIKEISAGLGHVLALLSDGTIAAWGFNAFGQVGNNDNRMQPVTTVDNTTIFKPVHVLIGGDTVYGSGSPMTGVTQIIAFGNQSLARSNGVWYGWGDNGNGQLGNPISTNSLGFLLVPALVSGMPVAH
jgi:alpha-tubulin suppressor-like RCC1 family protein